MRALWKHRSTLNVRHGKYKLEAWIKKYKTPWYCFFFLACNSRQFFMRTAPKEVFNISRDFTVRTGLLDVSGFLKHFTMKNWGIIRRKLIGSSNPSLSKNHLTSINWWICFFFFNFLNVPPYHHNKQSYAKKKMV